MPREGTHRFLRFLNLTCSQTKHAYDKQGHYEERWPGRADVRTCAGGYAKAVMDSVEDGVIAKGDAEDLLIIVSVFIHWQAADKPEELRLQLRSHKLQ